MYVEVKDNDSEIIKRVVRELYHFKCENNTFVKIHEILVQPNMSSVTARFYLNH